MLATTRLAGAPCRRLEPPFSALLQSGEGRGRDAPASGFDDLEAIAPGAFTLLFPQALPINGPVLIRIWVVLPVPQAVSATPP